MVSGAISSLLHPREHAALVHRQGDKRVAIWTPDRDPRWRIRNANVAIELLAGEVRSSNVYFSINQFHHCRQVRHLAALNALFVDVDSHDGEINLAGLLDAKLTVLTKGKIPDPSLVVFSGRGLHFYWFIAPTPPQALPRWQACQKTLQKLLDGDPNAVDCTRLLRIVGSVNPKAREGAQTVTGVLYSASAHSFDWLSEQILPRSRAEVRDIRADMARRRGGTPMTSNRGKRTIFEWWMAVYKDLHTIVEHHWRQGVPTGHRDTLLFLLAVALSWFTRQEALADEIQSVARRLTPTLTEAEVVSYTTSVRERAAQAAAGGQIAWNGVLRDPRYWFKRETLFSLLGDLIPEALERRLNAVMSDAERDRRRSEREAARDRHSEGRHRTTHAATEVRTRAIALAREGLSVRAVASKLSVPKTTVADWIRLANTNLSPDGSTRLI